MKRLIDKIYDKHPIIWQASVVAVIVFILFLAAWTTWNNTFGN